MNGGGLKLLALRTIWLVRLSGKEVHFCRVSDFGDASALDEFQGMVPCFRVGKTRRIK